MVQTELAYEKFQVKFNDNYETSKVSVDRGRFVLLANEAQNKLIENILDKKSNDEIRYIQKILVKDFKIDTPQSKEDADYFKLPDNYFDFSSAYTKASTKSCTNQKIYLYEIKDDNITIVMQDENQRPSFIAREAPFDFSSNNLVAYKDGFKHNELFLSYYRYPQQVRLIDPEDPESKFHPDFNFEFDEKFVDRIISMAVSEMKINEENQSFQINKQQAINKI